MNWTKKWNHRNNNFKYFRKNKNFNTKINKNKVRAKIKSAFFIFMSKYLQKITSFFQIIKKFFKINIYLF